MRQVKQTLRELMMGLIIWMLPVGLLLALFASNKLAALAGLLMGTLAAAGLLWHMYHHLDIALDLDAKHAQSHTQFAAMQRLGIMAVVLGVSMVGYRYAHPIGTVLGLFGVKISALMQPKLHSFVNKKHVHK